MHSLVFRYTWVYHLPFLCLFSFCNYLHLVLHLFVIYLYYFCLFLHGRLIAGQFVILLFYLVYTFTCEDCYWFCLFHLEGGHHLYSVFIITFYYLGSSAASFSIVLLEVWEHIGVLSYLVDCHLAACKFFLVFYNERLPPHPACSC